MSNINLSPAQLRGALGILNWSNRELAVASGIYVDTINKFCRGESKSYDTTLEPIKTVLERQGIEFLDGDGVRLAKKDVEMFVGMERFQDFMDFVYKYLAVNGGELCISITDERKLQGVYRDLGYHRETMFSLVRNKNVSGRILAADGNFKETWARLRRRPRTTNMSRVSFFVFGECLALITLEHDPSPYVVLHKIGPFASEYMEAFNAAWEAAEVI